VRTVTRPNCTPMKNRPSAPLSWQTDADTRFAVAAAANSCAPPCPPGVFSDIHVLLRRRHCCALLRDVAFSCAAFTSTPQVARRVPRRFRRGVGMVARSCLPIRGGAIIVCAATMRCGGKSAIWLESVGVSVRFARTDALHQQGHRMPGDLRTADIAPHGIVTPQLRRSQRQNRHPQQRHEHQRRL
jgi:hypothetical protein